MANSSYLTLNQILAQTAKEVSEVFPWDVEELLSDKTTSDSELLFVDIREPYEYQEMRIQNSINAPRGILETSCEWDYDETIPELVKARQRKVIVVCRSGNRSLLATQTLKMMGFMDVHSLKTGLRGWNEYDLPLVNDQGEVDPDDADKYHMAQVSDEQMSP